MADNLESKIKELNREILRLKTAHPVASNMITFYGVFKMPDPGSAKIMKLEITYVEGNQPIMTWIGYSFNSNSGYINFGEPVGNKQIMYAASPSIETGENYSLFSTRQILGIRRVS